MKSFTHQKKTHFTPLLSQEMVKQAKKKRPEYKRKEKRKSKGREKWRKGTKPEGKKESQMEKSSLSGLGKYDSWVPFVLITAEQRCCRY